MKKEYYKWFCTMVSCLLIVGSYAQQSVGSWREYRSYQSAALVAETPHHIFSVYYGQTYLGWNYDGSLMSYSKADGEVKLWSKSDGLNDLDIKCLGYNKNTKSLLIVYTNANIDILKEDGTIVNIASLKDDPNFQDKTINNLEFEGDYAYLATYDGFVVLNLAKTEIKDTYRLGRKCYSFCTYQDYVYVATENGVYRALATADLLFASNWNLYTFNYSGQQPAIRKLTVFENNLVFYQENNSVYYQDVNGNVFSLGTGAVKQLVVINNQLVAVRNTDIWFYTGWNNKSIVQVPALTIDAEGTADYWLASGAEGLMKIKKEDTNTGYSVLVNGIKISSPKRNINFSMIYEHDKLWVVGGGRWENRSNQPGTLMIKEKTGWNNIDESLITTAIGFDCKDFTSIAVNPSDPAHFFVSSWGEGVYEFQNNQFTTLHNESNSTLRSAKQSGPHYIRTSGLQFDRQDNLYVLNDEVSNTINIYNTTQKKWSSYYSSKLSGDATCVDQLLITENQKWLNFVRSTDTGIFVMDDQDTPTDMTDDQAAHSKTFFDQDGNSISVTNYYPAVEDMQGSIWVGTNNGPLIFNQSNQNLANGFNSCIRPKVPLNDGTNGAYFLLDGQTVTSIVVDGGNRKWIGTKGSGLFLVSPTGDEALANFSTTNSRLISDNIICMAMDQETGELFIGTDKGLVSYRTDAISGKEDYSDVYAFPNPVRPDYFGDVIVTGLVADSNVKITDLNGNLMVQGKSVGGQFTWDCRNAYGEKVKTGIYLVLASTSEFEETQSVVTKIMVVR